MKIEVRHISDLKRAEYNPRVRLVKADKEYKALKKSLQDYGYVEPIVINGRNNVVVGGHQRLTVLQDMGQETVECVVLDLDDHEEKKLNIALNKIEGRWEFTMLATILDELQGSDFETGFSKYEMDELIGVSPEEDYDNEPDETDNEEPEEETVTIKIGMYHFEMEHERFQDMMAGIRLGVGFGREEVMAELKRRLLNGN